ncbi:hypothetical protein WMY93_017386 [Mugilogobius chulae]|uniref:Ankyrin repeat domain-containing protein 34B n=1 Tax=Mugilogobius chulae TaxID=88201 RepID=A0AAW0NUL0_9GOBI
MGDLPDRSPLVSAASSGKLRLVRLLVEGGADVDGSARGDTALLAACKSLRRDEADQTGNEVVKVVNYLLQKKADPNAQDLCGRTALMFACEQRATAVVSSLLRAGADPTLQDQCGASALVYAVKAQHSTVLQPEAETSSSSPRRPPPPQTPHNNRPERSSHQGPPERPPIPDSSPLCMSPSDIVLKTPNSPETGNIFNFRAPVDRAAHSPSLPRQRGFSEPWLSIPNLTRLRHAYQRVVTPREDQQHHPGLSQSLLTLPNLSSAPPDPCLVPGSWGARRNTLPSLTVVPPVLHFPPLREKVRVKESQKLASRVSMLFLPRPPSSAPPPSSKGSVRAALLKPRMMESSHILGKLVRRGQP